MGDDEGKRVIDVDSLKVAELREELELLDLSVTGSKAILRERLRAALIEEKDENEENNEDDDEDERNEEAAAAPPRQSLTFKDVEESLQTFSGDNKQNVKKWLEEFEETSQLCRWTEVQKIIYAKRLLRGSAKLFVNFESCSKTWKQLKGGLTSEFSKTVSSRQIHKELAKRKKQSNETFQEYIYKMLEIASQTEMELEAKLQYIIDGIQDEEANKAILYGAKSVRELRAKFVHYEAMKENVSSKSKPRSEQKTDQKDKKGSQTRGEQKRCYNCGDKTHFSSDCPSKSKGTKCFKCDEFGHIASKCTKPSDKSKDKDKDSCNVASCGNKKTCKTVRINAREINALIDTGSDFHLMRADEYVKLGAPKLDGRQLVFKGIGSTDIPTLGSFSTAINIDDGSFQAEIHVVSDKYLEYDLLLGSELLSVAEVRMKDGKITVLPLETEESSSETGSDVPEVFKIEICNESNEIDFTGIEDVVIKNELKEIIDGYETNKADETRVKMRIVVTDDEPVYQRPRRLSMEERAKVNEQIKKWVEDGIVRPSASEYASPIVLVKKKNGSMRICIDFRLLNKKILKDRYPLPLIEDQLDQLQGAKIFMHTRPEGWIFPCSD